MKKSGDPSVDVGCARAKKLLEYERKRFDTQVRFAHYLCRKNGKNAGAWKKLISKGETLVGAAFAAGAPAGVRTAVRKAEGLMSPIGEAAKAYTIHCIAHAHIDMNWMWSWPETVNTTNDTFTTVLNLMKEFPEFTFSQSQASVYRIIEQHNPSMLKEIAKLVKKGRWEVTASHWVEGDKNLAGGEALCRHLLYTRRYMQDLFGLAPEDVAIDWSPDTFGHAHTVPTYLVRGGVKYVYLHRPGVHTPPQPRPRAFRWRGPDGSRVLVMNDMHLGYNGSIGPSMAKRALQDFCDETGLKSACFVYGMGDHGGGPTRRDLVTRRDLDAWPVYPRVICSTARDFFAELDAAKLPVIDDELNFEFTGCYTTQTLIKRANRFSEKKLQDAEAAASLVWSGLGGAYPSRGFEEKWRDTLFSHFHDILPGSGVRDTRTYTHGLFQEIAAFTSIREAEALRTLAGAVDTSAAAIRVQDDLPPSAVPRAMGGGMGMNTAEGDITRYGHGKGSDRRAFLVWNPLPRGRDEVIEVRLWDPGWGWQDRDIAGIPFRAVGPDGSAVPVQVMGKGHYWGHDHVDLAFPVSVGPYGYAMYYVEEGTAKEKSAGTGQTGIEHQCGYTSYERGPEGLSNGLVSVSLDMTTGGIASLVDLTTGTALISPDRPAPVLQYAVERARGMSAWTVEHTGPWQPMNVRKISRGSKGPYRAGITAEGTLGDSNFSVSYVLKAGDPALYVDISGTWFERGSPEKGTPVLRLSLPLALEKPKAEYEIPFGSISRDMKNGEEVPALRWAHVGGKAGKKAAGCLVLNDCKHGHSLVENTMNVTLVRSSYSPDPLPEIGRHDMRFALLPTGGRISPERAIESARAFNHELKVINTDAHKGTLPGAGSFVAVSPDSVVLDTIKRAEEGDALVVRLYDPSGRAAQAKLSFDRFCGRVKSAVETDLLERPVKKNSAKVSGNAVTVRVPKRGITTVRVVLKKN